MGIPESQLNTWSHQGAISSSRDTYATVKSALEAANTPYASKGFEVFLQGSYCNDTNTYAESDVDVVIRLDAVYYYDTSELDAQGLSAFNSSFVPATYAYSEFKADVITVLRSRFGDDVRPGTKAVKIASRGSRRSADVIVACQFRRYYTGTGILGGITQCHEGICFFMPNGVRVVNYPKQHSANCTTKHQATNQRFKPMVRIVKNMRNRLISENVIEPGLAPSYFVEGLLYNVPNDKFAGNYSNTFSGAINWVRSLDREALNQLVCASQQHYLIRDNLPTCWPYANYNSFLVELAKLWNEWR